MSIFQRHSWQVSLVREIAVHSTGEIKCGPIPVVQARCMNCGTTLPENHSPPAPHLEREFECWEAAFRRHLMRTP